ncbi:50S ribosomal protein L32 [Actinocorallia libanotica]|uniref:Large ribosomal subunit protein bL32 n=1 Tax=Actinocorallia libanotica TaxID=46162 RepID=A0ABN1RVS5_9ACTN
MAVPKRKKSRARTRTRRARWKAPRPELVDAQVDGRSIRVPRRLVKALQRGLITG